jgi:hypothetical protein
VELTIDEECEFAAGKLGEEDRHGGQPVVLQPLLRRPVRELDDLEAVLFGRLDVDDAVFLPAAGVIGQARRANTRSDGLDQTALVVHDERRVRVVDEAPIRPVDPHALTERDDPTPEAGVRPPEHDVARLERLRVLARRDVAARCGLILIRRVELRCLHLSVSDLAGSVSARELPTHH